MSVNEPRPSHDFIIPTETVDEVKALVRHEVPEAMIGTKDLGEGKTFFTVTLFARSPQLLAAVEDVMAKFQDKSELSGERPAETALSDIVEKVRKAQQDS